MKPNIILSQVSHLGITATDLDDVLNDHEELVTNLMEKAAKHANGNVLGVGVTAVPHASGTGDSLAFLLLVDRLDQAARQRLSGNSTAGYRIVLEEIGAINASGRHEGGANEQAQELEASDGFKGKYRPVTCGVSIAPSAENYSGTLGCQVTSNKIKYMLSNNHVLADCNALPVNTPISQPSPPDGGVPADVVANLSYFVPLGAPGGTAPVDAAIAAFNNTPVDARMEREDNKTEKMVSPIVAPVPKMDVQKSGRTTGVTKGKVVAIGMTVATNYAGYGTVTIQNAFSVKHASGQFSQPGDSGSVITTAPQNNPVGLLFASDSDSKTTFANTMQEVLTELAHGTGYAVNIVY
jgi:hypothetical protein